MLILLARLETLVLMLSWTSVCTSRLWTPSSKRILSLGSLSFSSLNFQIFIARHAHNLHGTTS